MNDHSEALGVFALIAFMTLFATGLTYEGTMLMEPPSRVQLVVPDPNP
jgi:hypothetical protein